MTRYRAVLGAILFCVLCPIGPRGSSPASAVIFSSDPRPGATLLLPYFDSDLDDPNGDQTVARIFHTGRRPRSVHVTLWTDWAIPTLAFDLVLDAHGSTEISLREIFNGRLPASATEFIVPGPAKTSGIFFTGCSSRQLESADVLHIRGAHTGAASQRFGRRCAGYDHGDNIARGFLTIDSTFMCAGDLPPTDAGYFADDGPAADSNALWGYWALTNRTDGTAAGDALVAIEANPFLTGATFYSEFATSAGDDHRERLSHEWGADFVVDQEATTEVIFWRDPREQSVPVPCGAEPPGFPLAAAAITMSDGDGNTINIAPSAPFPAATNRVAIGDASFPTIYQFGHFQVVLPVPVVAQATRLVGAETSGVLVPELPQGHLTVVRRYSSGVATAHRGTDLRSSVVAP